MFTIVFFLLALVCGAVNLAVAKEKRPLKIFTKWILFVCMGFGGVLAFMGHAFRSEQIAHSIGWETSPFQFEVAVSDLAFGVLGLLCLVFHGRFWLAAGIGYSVFLLGCAVGHVRDIAVHQNTAVNNAGPILWFGDIIFPLLLLALVILCEVKDARSRAARAA